MYVGALDVEPWSWGDSLGIIRNKANEREENILHMLLLLVLERR